MIEPEAAPQPRQAAAPPRRASARRRTPPDGRSVLVSVLLVLILLVGAYFRFIGQNWDDYTHLHPDERFLTDVTSRLAPVAGIGEYFDTATSTLNPNNMGYGFYVYGTLPLFVVKAVSGMAVQATGNGALGGYNGVQLVGRSVSAVADLMTIVFIFLIGRRLYNRWIGLLAAALYTFAVLPIQLSHFWTMDAFTNLPVVIAFWLAVRVLDDGGWRNYVGFGLAFGAAVGCRINVVPLAGVLVLAAILRVLPVTQVGYSIRKREETIKREFLGLVAGGVVSLLTFRIVQPYAFAGPSFFGILPNPSWWSQMQEVQRQVSGQVDFPPNHQWTGRIPYLFSWQNMVLWGMGVPLGLAGWLGWAWAGLQTLRGRATWKRHLLPVVWILVYFGWQGGGWVMSMRYYMPIYPFLILLAAWALVTLAVRAQRAVQDRARAAGLRRALAIGLLGGVTLFTLVWAFAFTRIYTRQLTRVQASQWVLQNIPADYSLEIQGEGGASRMVNLGLFNDTVTHQIPLVENSTRYFADGDEQSAPFTVPFDLTASRVVLDFTSDAQHDLSEETLWVGLYDAETNNLLGETRLSADFAQPVAGQGGTTVILTGGSREIATIGREMLFANPISLHAGQRLTLQFRAEGGAPFELGRISLGYDVNATHYMTDSDGSTGMQNAAFTAPLTGTIAGVHAAYLGDPLQDSGEETLWVGLWDVAGQRIVAEATVTADFGAAENPLGQPYDILFPEPVEVSAGQSYELRTRAEAGAPIIVAGSVVATEGPWDDGIPWKVCAMADEWTPDAPPGLISVDNLSQCRGVDGFGMGYYQGIELYLSYEDGDTKRQILIDGLNEADYLTISSNRFYDSLSRLPMRFPMTLRYYDALFSGELGFELVETFQSTFTLGSLVISDQVLPTYDVPSWLNEFEAEEAFHVYDHPVVFVFHKTADYDPERVAAILDGVETASTADSSSWGNPTRVIGVIPWGGAQASQARTALMFTESMRAIQYSGGTWSDMFDLGSLINRSQAAAVIAWWLTLAVFGWLIWPLLFTFLPALADRGYPLARIAGLLVISWLAWLGASLQLRTWTREGILLAMGLVLLVSLIAGYRQRAALAGYVRTHWRQMLVLEGIMLLLFLVFIGIRLGNPDLWDTRFGGEKPMDFAYLNGVLRSTVFPPINPWYAGGYINYYYYGFVLVGTPIKLLGLNPSVAYNLIIPTLFALTGIGAFSAAFNLAASLRQRRTDGTLGARLGSPWVAGSVGMLLAVVLGNLDDIRVLLDGFARAGGGRDVSGGGGPFLPLLGDIAAGVSSLFQGQALPIDPGWWLWNPTRVMNHTGNAITEIPFFSFLYGDPHAHGIALPLTLLVIGWIIHEVLHAAQGGRGRSSAASFGALALGALAVGILRATNFADWVTYLVLTLFGLTLAAYLRHRALRDRPDDGVIPNPGPFWRFLGIFGGGALYLGWQSFKRWHLSWASLLHWLGQVAGLVVLGGLFLAPYSYWYATADAVPQLWYGDRTPLWAYLDIHGVFLFLIFSLLIWDTGRYLRSVRVRQLVGRRELVAIVLIGLGWLALIVLTVRVLNFPIAIVALPLLFWAALLFFRPGQAPAMRLMLAFVVLSAAMTFVVDVMVWAGDIGRQNTVFKFYMQVWILFSVVGGVAFALLIRACEWWRAWARNTWLVGVTVLFTIAAMYPLLAIQGRWANRLTAETPLTLDGMEFMKYATHGEHGVYFPLAEDYAMIRWLQDNVVGTPIILEGRSEREYLWGPRVSIYTGLPTLVGYSHHERQQRTVEPLSRFVDQRALQTDTIYHTTDYTLAMHLLKAYDVSFIVVGQLERAYYSPEGLDKFRQMAALGMLQVVYEQGETLVYQVVRTPDQAEPQVVAER